MGRGKRSRSRSEHDKKRKTHKENKDKKEDREKDNKKREHRKSASKSRSRERTKKDKSSGFSAQPPLQINNPEAERKSKWGEADPVKLIQANFQTSATPRNCKNQQQFLQKKEQPQALIAPSQEQRMLNLQTPMQYTFVPGMNPNILKALNDPNKIRRKIPIPPDPTFNYIGLIIGPKGVSQKKLEEETGCKILIRGKGSQKEGQPPQPDDNEDLHVLVVADTAQQAAMACEKIERILLADQEERNRLRQEQMKLIAQSQIMQVGNSAQLQTASGIIVTDPNDLSMTTPYGPPSKDAYVYPVPNDCVGLVIGVKGETIMMLKEKSGCRNVQVATDSAPGSSTRNVFIEGDPEAVERCQQMLQEIVDNQRVVGNKKVEYHVHDQYVALVIGKKGVTIKSINERTGAFVIITHNPEYPVKQDHKAFAISGTEDAIRSAVKEIEMLLYNAKAAHLQKQGIDPTMVLPPPGMFCQTYPQLPPVNPIGMPGMQGMPGMMPGMQGMPGMMPGMQGMPGMMPGMQGMPLGIQGMQGSMQGMQGGMQQMQQMQPQGFPSMMPPNGQPADQQFTQLMAWLPPGSDLSTPEQQQAAYQHMMMMQQYSMNYVSEPQIEERIISRR